MEITYAPTQYFAKYLVGVHAFKQFTKYFTYLSICIPFEMQAATAFCFNNKSL